MPKNFSQKGFAEIISLIAVAFMLVTIPVAKQLADKRQELRKLAAESKCPRSCNTERPGECYSWAGDGCDWQGPLQYPQGSCYCKRDREAVSQQQAQQQASSSQTTCDNANYSWCKDGIRYYCNENKSLTPISQKWQEGNSCYVCGAAAREPVSLSECSSDITNQCGGKNNGDAWCEGTTIVQCVRDPSGYLVKNYTSTPCSGAQTTTISEKPAAPGTAQPTCETKTCTNKTADGYTVYYYYLRSQDGSLKGPFTSCSGVGNFSIANDCPATPGAAQPTCETKTCNYKTTDGYEVLYYQLCKNGKCGLYTSCSGVSEISIATYCPTAPKPAAPAESAPKNIYICQKYDDGKYYARYYDNNGNITSNKPCEHGCKNDRECNPAPVQPEEVEIDTTTILCSVSNCNQILQNWPNKTIFLNRTAKLGNSFYFAFPCIEETKINNIEEYCEVKTDEVPAPNITETTEETIGKPVANPCAEEDDGRAVIHQNSCWTCLNGQLYQMTNDEYCGIKPTPKQQVTQSKPPAAKPERSITFMERVNNAFCTTPPINLFCQLLGYVPYQ